MSLASLIRNEAPIVTLQSALFLPDGKVRSTLGLKAAMALLERINRERYDHGWSQIVMAGRAPVDTTKAEWCEPGEASVPESRRPAFLAAVEGMMWRGAEGSHPFSPGMAIKAVIAEFGITPVEAVSYNVAWYLPDGPETATYTAIGIKTRKQRLIFLDGGCAIAPTLILPA